MPTMIEEKQLVQRLLASTANTILYQPPSGVTRTRIKTIFVCNTTAGALTYSIYVNQTGSSVSDQNALLKLSPLAARVTDQFKYEGEDGIILESTGSIVVNASAAASITMTLYGQEIKET